ncbi:MAG: hypothetical protein APR53_00255 [Methanoculleus sp. SDB]|nr:MAG: hypothetical protein APR53_00255 [Methanoculleus sp. SDB]
MGEETFDMIIPPGTPRSIIADIVNNFDVEIVHRKERMYFANMDGDMRELLAFRGKKDVIEKVQEQVFQKLKEFIGEE